MTDVGVRLPAHLTASGLAMLAALPPQQVNALFPSRRVLTPPPRRRPGVADPAARAPGAARGAGHAEEDGFVTPGFASVACAVLDHTGHPIAAVAVTYPAPEGEPGGARRARRPRRRTGHPRDSW